MFNLIKMDMYRLVHSKSARIIILFTIGLAVFSVVMTDTDIQYMQEDASYIEESTGERTVGIYVEADPEWAEGKIEIGSIISAEMRSEMLEILCIIFVALFVSAEQKNGYIKNIAGQFPRREMMVISKFITIAVQVLVMTLVFSAVVTTAGFVLWGEEFYLGSVMQLVKYLGVQYLLHLGFAVLIMLLSTVTRSAAFGITAGIILCSGLAVPVYALINKKVSDLWPGIDFDINLYSLDGNITMMKIGSAGDMMIRGAAVGVVFAAVSVILAMILIKKRDIR